MEEIRIDFWINNQVPFAMRSSIHVPAIGDEVRFDGGAYKVVYRIWIYDEKYPRVALNIKKVGGAKAKEGGGTD